MGRQSQGAPGVAGRESYERMRLYHIRNSGLEFEIIPAMNSLQYS
jgi:hypothetical protein